MRIHVTGPDADASFQNAVQRIIYARLAPMRNGQLAALDMTWTSGDPSRLVDVRYVAAKRKVTCKLVIAPGPRAAHDMARLTIGMLAVIVDRLAQRGTVVDFSRAAAAIARDFASLER